MRMKGRGLIKKSFFGSNIFERKSSDEEKDELYEITVVMKEKVYPTD